jgi:hypothetical protein
MSRATDYRNRRQQAQASEPTAELTLPSGAVFVVRRPPIQVWITAGKIPQSFLAQLLDAKRDGQAESLPEAETLAAVGFLRDALVYAVVEPRLRIGATGDDELDPSDLSPEDFEFLTGWIMAGSPGVPVPTKGGEVSTESLSRFRQKQPGGRAAGAGADGAEVQQQAEQVAGVAV